MSAQAMQAGSMNKSMFPSTYMTFDSNTSAYLYADSSGGSSMTASYQNDDGSLDIDKVNNDNQPSPTVEGMVNDSTACSIPSQCPAGSSG